MLTSDQGKITRREKVKEELRLMKEEVSWEKKGTEMHSAGKINKIWGPTERRVD